MAFKIDKQTRLNLLQNQIMQDNLNGMVITCHVLYFIIFCST